VLLHLKIANLATFRELSLDFSPGLTCVTGETGSGKSLFVDALSFLSGKKNRILFVRQGASEGFVEAIFSPAVSIPVFLAEAVRPGDDWVIRRTLLSNGRTRQQLNGGNITQSQLQELGDVLMDLVGQGEGFRLQNPRTHSEYLDVYGETLPLLMHYERLRAAVLEKKKSLADMEFQWLENERHRERIREISEDRESLAPEPGEWEKLQANLSVFLHNQDLLTAASHVYDQLYGEEDSILGRIRKMAQDLERLRAFDPRLEDVSIPLSEAYAILRETAEASRHYLDGLEFEPSVLAKTEARIHDYQRLARKYGVDSAELLAFFDSNSVDASKGTPEQLERLRKEVQDATRDLCVSRDTLTEKRRSASLRLGQEVTERLPRLRLEKSRFFVEIQPRNEDFLPGGGEEIRFFFTANTDLPPKPLDQVASGGELSRILLVLKQVLAEKDSVETLVFDEVDSGIGGEVGETVGDIIAEIAGSRQVIAITHLHQVARKAGSHLVIRKEQKDNVTESTIFWAEGEVRVFEIARMLGGSGLAPSTITLARELLIPGNGKNEK